MVKKLKENIFDVSVFIIFGIVILFLFRANYTPNTWLTGWDNLHPEFDLALNIRRAFSALWQEYQGVGLLGGMAHAADLPRLFILYILGAFFPVDLLRYVWTFLMLFIGPLGVYALVKRFVGEKDELVSTLAGFAAGVFYLFNLATVQTFYVPFETFTSFYGFLPWLIWSALSYLKDGGKRSLLTFFVISFLATSGFYVQTLFVVYILILIPFLIESVKSGLKGWGRAIILGAVILFANAFWLIPAGYFTLTKSDVVRDAKLSYMATYENQLMNESFGELSDTALMRGYWFDYTDLGTDGKFDRLLSNWREYLAYEDVSYTGYILFAFGVFGLAYALIKRGKLSFRISWAVIFLIGFLMLSTKNPPFGGAYELLINTIPLFGQIFRAVFTKWSVATAFALSVGIGFSTVFFHNMAVRGKRVFLILSAVGFTLSALYFTKPMFEGDLIAPSVKQEIPKEYLNLMSLLSENYKNKRIAFFPVHTFWGWNFYDWGYRGSGILWYGVEQPILDRAFDGWSNENEAYYLEISEAVYSSDIESFRKVLDKYDTELLLIDSNVIVPEGDSSVLRLSEIGNMVNEIGAIKIWEEEGLSLFYLRDKDAIQNYLYAPKLITNASNFSKYAKRDPVFNQYSNYGKIEGGSSVFPFTNLLEERLGEEIEIEGDSLIYKAEVGKGKLVIPALQHGTKLALAMEAVLSGSTLAIDFLPAVTIKDSDKSYGISDMPKVEIGLTKRYENLLVVLGGNDFALKDGNSYRGVFEVTSGEPISIGLYDATEKQSVELPAPFTQKEVGKCWEREGVDSVLSTSIFDDELTITSRDAAGCMTFPLGKIGELNGLMKISLPYRSQSSARPHFCLLREGETVNCENQDVFYVTEPSDSWAVVERVVPIEKDVNYTLSIVGRSSDEAGKTWSISYKQPELTYYPLTEEVIYQSDFWDDLNNVQVIDIASDLVNLNFWAKPTERRMESMDRYSNCDNLDRGTVLKLLSYDSVIFKSDVWGSLCDYEYLDDLTQKASYVMRITAENISGNPLKFYLYNLETKRADIENTLKLEKYDNYYSVLAHPDSSSSYTLNLINKSFGEVSENILKRVYFYPIPTDWVSSWYVLDPNVNTGIQNKHEPSLITSGLTVSNVEKLGTYSYSASLMGGSGVVVLSQGYNSGWSAKINNKKLKHIKFNNWSNAFIVEDGQCEGECQIEIKYTPQYLQNFGFLLLFVFPALFVIKKRRTD